MEYTKRIEVTSTEVNRMTQLGIGLIGCGHMGKILVHNLHGLGIGAKIVAVCDSDGRVAQALGAELGVPSYQEAQQLLDHPGVKAVIIATPHNSHMALAIAAAEAGKHIFCEKAMAMNVAECDRMIEAAQAAGVMLMVGQVLRLMTVNAKVREILASGVLGNLVAMSTRLHGFVDLPPENWWGITTISGGYLNAMSIHEFDLMRAMAGDVASVYAVRAPKVRPGIEYDETVYATFRFTNGVVGTHEVTTSTTLYGRTGKLIGDKGSLTYDNLSGRIEYRTFGGQPQIVEFPPEELDVDPGVKVELEDFVASIREGREPIITGRDGRAAVEMAQACYLSIERGEVIHLPLLG
jgi:predicted dehydrogenase